MTATPDARSKSLDTIRKAGTLFGLDLSGLFDDEGEGDLGGFEGLQPSFKTTAYVKGRSPSTLTYGATNEPARTTEFSLAPKTESSFTLPALPSPLAPTETKPAETKPAETTPAAQLPSTTPTSAATPTATETPQATKTYQGFAGGRSIFTAQPEYGGIGFGQGDLERARSEGYSDESIKTFLQNFPGMIGPTAASALGIQPKSTSSITSTAAPTYTPAPTPTPTQTYYAPTPTPTYTPAPTPSPAPTPGNLPPTFQYTPYSAPVSQYQAPTTQNWQAKAQSEQGFGAGSLSAARSSGANDNAIRNFLRSNPQITVGAAARSALGL
jgi:hypothetical protein